MAGNKPDYSVSMKGRSGGYLRVGAAWNSESRKTGKRYISVSLDIDQLPEAAEGRLALWPVDDRDDDRYSPRESSDNIPF